MKCFQDNFCRLCPKSFCCKDCRIRHEEKIHKVNPECEICIYGRATIKGASVLLLNHIKSAHWPLHCVFCKKVFTSLDELVPHDKCTFKLENHNLKMQSTPKTPLAEHDKPSPEVTPFYKSLKPGPPQIGSTISMVVTSTPYNKEEKKCDKITPLNQSEIHCHKSNLKLTGSSSLNDSKKSERRVTFSETPSVAEFCRKPKYLPLKQITTNNEDEEEVEIDDSSDDSYSSLPHEEKIFKVVPMASTRIEGKENRHEDPFFDNCDSNESLFESALTKLDFNSSNFENIDNIENIDNKANHFNLSLQINVFNTVTDNNLNFKGNEVGEVAVAPNKMNLWSSMTNIVKSVVNNISFTAQNSFCRVSSKRSQPDDDDAFVEAPHLKRMKLTDIKCRRPIRHISPLYQFRRGTRIRSRYVDKATQTDECWM